VAETMWRFLPKPFSKAAPLLRSTMPDGQTGIDALRFLPHSCFVQKYGLEDFEAAMEFQYELTKRFTAEFCIRAFLERFPEPTYARLRDWAADDNPHVRRLVSEGTRPRLPWAPRLRAFQHDPRPVIELLEPPPAQLVPLPLFDDLPDESG